jgi:hypothetical protein
LALHRCIACFGSFDFSPLNFLFALAQRHDPTLRLWLKPIPAPGRRKGWILRDLDFTPMLRQNSPEWMKYAAIQVPNSIIDAVIGPHWM